LLIVINVLTFYVAELITAKQSFKIQAENGSRFVIIKTNLFLISYAGKNSNTQAFWRNIEMWFECQLTAELVAANKCKYAF
jgi:hypothetical protein